MYTTVRATCSGSIVGSISIDPFAWGTPLLILSARGVAALPMSIWLVRLSHV